MDSRRFTLHRRSRDFSKLKPRGLSPSGIGIFPNPNSGYFLHRVKLWFFLLTFSGAKYYTAYLWQYVLLRKEKLAALHSPRLILWRRLRHRAVGGLGHLPGSGLVGIGS